VPKGGLNFGCSLMFVDIAVWVAVQQGTDYGMWLQNGLGDVDFDSGVVRGVQSNAHKGPTRF
jgi:hypothetical protein